MVCYESSFFLFSYLSVLKKVPDYKQTKYRRRFVFISLMSKQQGNWIFCCHFSIHKLVIPEENRDISLLYAYEIWNLITVCLSRAINKSRKKILMSLISIYRWSILFSRYYSSYNHYNFVFIFAQFPASAWFPFFFTCMFVETPKHLSMERLTFNVNTQGWHFWRWSGYTCFTRQIPLELDFQCQLPQSLIGEVTWAVTVCCVMLTWIILCCVTLILFFFHLL